MLTGVPTIDAKWGCSRYQSHREDGAPAWVASPVKTPSFGLLGRAIGSASSVFGEVQVKGRELRGLGDWSEDHPAKRVIEVQVKPAHGTSIDGVWPRGELVVLNADPAGRALPLHPGPIYRRMF